MKTSAVVILLMLFSVSMARMNMRKGFRPYSDNDESNEKKVTKNQPVHWLTPTPQYIF